MRFKGEIVDVGFGNLFSWYFRFFGLMLVLGGGVGLTINPLLGILFILIGIVLITGKSGTIINRSAKTYREYMSFIFIKTGEELSFSGIEKIFINPGQEKLKIHTAHTNSSQTFTNEIFNAYLKFDSGEKIQLLKRKDKEKLINELKQLSEFLNTPLIDNT